MRQKGSITVFLSLILVCVSALIFACSISFFIFNKVSAELERSSVLYFIYSFNCFLNQNPESSVTLFSSLTSALDRQYYIYPSYQHNPLSI